MTDQNTWDLLEAIASTLAIARGTDRQGILIGHLPTDQAPHIDRIDCTDGDKQIWLRLTNGEAWLLRAHKLGSQVQGEDRAGLADVVASYCRYRDLEKHWILAHRTAEAAYGSTIDLDQLIQAWYEDILGDDERSDWDRWVSTGNASAEEWAHINWLRDSGQLTD